jgi:hypothetical protein
MGIAVPAIYRPLRKAFFQFGQKKGVDSSKITLQSIPLAPPGHG